MEETLRRSGRGKVRRPFARKSAAQARGSSKPLLRAIVDFGADSSFEKAARKLREHYGLEVPAGPVARECLRVARTLEQTPRMARTLAPDGPETIVAEADGTMIPLMETPRQAQGDRRKQRSVLWKEMRLFAAQAQGSARTHYAAGMERGLPIGSGLIESGHRHVLQARLKIPGAWWRADNAHAMAQLRVCRANGLWSQLWRN